MYENEKFEKVGEIPAGALVLKFPGTEVSMLYDSGIAYVNENNNVGQLELGIRDIETKEVGEAEGMMGTLGRQLAEQVNDPDVKVLIKNIIATKCNSQIIRFIGRDIGWTGFQLPHLTLRILIGKK